jgi:hypothetical protein
MSKRQEKRQQITFDDSSNIIYIIPSIEEIKDIKSDLWWTLAELANIKHNASQEIKCFIKKHPNIKNNQVIKQLFISGNILDDEDKILDDKSSNILYNNSTEKIQISRTQTYTNLFSICEQSDLNDNQNKDNQNKDNQNKDNQNKDNQNKDNQNKDNQNKDNQDLDFIFLMDDI